MLRRGGNGKVGSGTVGRGIFPMSQSACSAAEPYALRVMGDSMRPEFEDGHIIIVDPGVPPFDGAFVVLETAGEFQFGQLRLQSGSQRLHFLNPSCHSVAMTPSCRIKGVVVQRFTGRRRDLKHYPVPDFV